MKRTPLPARTKPIARTKPLARGSAPKRTTRPRKQSDRNVEVRRLDAEWSSMVRSSAHYRCERCGAPETPFAPLDAHHIRPKSTTPSLRYDVANGIALCRADHEWAHRKPLAFRAWLADRVK